MIRRTFLPALGSVVLTAIAGCQTVSDSYNRMFSGGKPAVDVVDGTRATLACLRLLDALRSPTKVEIDLASLIGKSEASAKVRVS